MGYLVTILMRYYFEQETTFTAADATRGVRATCP